MKRENICPCCETKYTEGTIQCEVCGYIVWEEFETRGFDTVKCTQNSYGEVYYEDVSVKNITIKELNERFKQKAKKSAKSPLDSLKALLDINDDSRDDKTTAKSSLKKTVTDSHRHDETKPSVSCMKISTRIVVMLFICLILLSGSLGIYFGVTNRVDEDNAGSQNHGRISVEHDGDKFKVGSDAVKSDATADSSAESDELADSDATLAEEKLNSGTESEKDEAESENRKPKKSEKDEADSKKRESDKKKSDDEEDDNGGLLDRAKEEAKDAVEGFFDDND